MTKSFQHEMRCACTCMDGTCGFCAMNLWAIGVETRLHAAEDFIDSDRFLTSDDLDNVVDRAVRDAFDEDKFLTERDLEDYVQQDALDRAIEDIDLDGYVKQDDLADEITSALEDSDLVEKAAAGATAGAIRSLQTYATKADHAALVRQLEDRLNADAPARLNALGNLTFGQRLRCLVTGKVGGGK